MTTIHVFEESGLGIAPFRLVRVEARRYKAHPDAPSQPGASCDYCMTGIVETCIIRDVNGKEFKVGNECVKKTGDRGIIDPIKVALNRLRTEERHQREDARIAAATASLMTDDALRATLSAFPHPYANRAEQGLTLLDSVAWLMKNAGRKGKVEASKVVEQYLTKKLSQGEIEAAMAARATRLEAEKAQAEFERLAEVKIEARRLESVKNENVWLLSILNGEGQFVSDMRSRIKMHYLVDCGFSERQLDILADIYGKSAGRSNSKKYSDAVDFFWKKAGRM
jgi:hypothetical protein